MENMDALAAAAQTQGLEDAAAKVETSDPSAAGSGEVGLSVVAAAPPLAPNPAVDGAGEKRKRGRYGKLVVRPPAPKRVKPEEEDEDVCFICFDGGSMVLCDRKGCPKAYHPACIKRDEAFFQSTARWYCGWHICSVCRKASHYLCYTCSYSLCKKCIKDADYSCVRRNKGFCSTCMKTIMLLENKGQANNESIQVDFDDKTSWEYLFKVYWVVLKDKLSLTLDELTRAQKPYKDLDTTGCKPLLSNVVPNAVKAEVPISDRSTEHSESNKSHVDINVNKINNEDTEKATDTPCIKDKATDTPCIKDKATDEPEVEKSRVKAGTDQDTKKKSNCKNTYKKEPEKPGTDSCSSSSSTEWATRDLLEFVAHMKNGDTSALSQFDVQMLLLDYIKKNNLRDPRRKGQIICDQRLKNLFGKPRAGHIEMLKLLESHFLVEDSKKSSFIPAGLVSSIVKSEMSVDGSTYEPPMPIKSRKRKTCKKSGEKAPTQNNLKEYAAIDVHNINLVYLQRNLMEKLLEDRESFNDKVIGSIVRIKILSSDQKQDVHRLVQVVGTTKVGEPYKIGDRTTNVMLEVLNLDKKEVVSIDAISNHEFTEDECRRLRQSIRCGLVKQFTVGEVQNKAMALQPVRVNDCLEAEILRLNHLRDRASENGRKKELREYVEKLQLLKSPEERARRISEIPEIHSDPKMSPYYESEEDTKSGDNGNKEYVRSSYSRVPQNGRKSVSRNKKDKEERTTWARNRMRKNPDETGSNSSDKHSNLVTGGRNNHVMRSSELETSTETATVGNLPSSSVVETEKFWHYCDPNGKIQGPFSMMQLRKWSTTGLFPPDMRIWTNHEQHDSVLLTDAFNGKFNLAPNSSDSGAREEKATEEVRVINEITNVSIGDSKETGEVRVVNEITNASIGDSKETGEVRAVNEITNVSIGDNKQTGEVGLVKEITNVSIGDSKQTGEVGLVKEITNVSIGDSKQTEEVGLVKEITNVSIGDSKQTEPALALGSNNNASVSSESNSGLVRADETSSWPQCWDLLKDSKSKSDVNDDQTRDLPPSSNSGKKDEDFHPHGPPQNGENNSNVVTVENLIITSVPELPNRSNTEDHVGLANEENSWPVNIDVECGPIHDTPSLDIPNVNLSLLDLPSPTPKTVVIDQSNVPMQNFEIFEFPSPKPKQNEDGLATETKQSEFINFTEPNSGQIWSGASEVHLPEAPNEWCGYSPTPAQPPLTIEDVLNSTPNETNWGMTINQTIELDAMSEESVSDLLAEVDAMNMQGASFPSPTFMKFARELMEDDDDCFSSIEFSRKSDTSGIQLAPEPSVACKPISVNTFDFPTSSSVHSSLSSEGKVGGNLGPVVGSESVDPGWCTTVQGNINLVTVQGDVNLVLGQGMGWGNPNMNPSPRNGNGSWERQRMQYGSPREWGRSPWGRQQQYGGGYSRQVPKGQRVCKFYEGGHCKKGAFCDYLHP